MSRAGAASAVLAVAVSLGACGGAGTHKSSSSSTSTTASQSAASRGRLIQTVRVNGAGKPASQAKARPGNQVQLRTNIAGSRSAGPQPVTVSAATGPSSALSITATSPGHRSQAQITSADGRPLTLASVHYTCALPPAPTFCPVQHASGGSHSFKLSFMAAPRTGIALSATVGPLAGKAPPPSTSGGLPTAAYTPTELLLAHPPTAGAGAGATATSGTATGSTTIGATTTTSTSLATSTNPTTSTSLTTTTGLTTTAGAGVRATPAVSVSPGSRVTMTTRLKGLPGGLPQQTTVTIDKGPAESLTVSAAVPQAATSKATITRAGGGKLVLGSLVFVCTAPPAASVCPPQQIVSRAHQYSVTFMASPHSPLIVLQAALRSG
jgi:hypothetical protein